MARVFYEPSDYRPRILLVGVQAPYNRNPNIESYYEEFINLVKSNGVQYDETYFLRLRTIEAGTFLTSGQLESIKKICDEKNITELIISEPLSPQQERNLSDYLHVRIFDRTQLILEIFEKAAHSAEGKAQVEIAMLEHKKSRLAGRGVHLSQQSGALGLMGGFGETAKEKERRHLETLMLRLKRQLEQLEKTRETQRKQRLKSNLPLICLIGYTNTGKSTILNALTKSNVLAEDKLFATLDTTTRELFIDGTKRALISDTVGFIQLLPHKLIDAFKSTLAELQYAHLLVQVIDISDPNLKLHMQVVDQILKDLNVTSPMLYAFNKADKIEMTPQLELEIHRFQPHVLISATQPSGLDSLIKYLDTWTNEYKSKNASL
ncbi:MAG TPA: GTPase HflX [Candidatus Babeliales bacterium]|nr:GTPase HflX [Candidatus Babeliales bacterium]